VQKFLESSIYLRLVAKFSNAFRKPEEHRHHFATSRAHDTATQLVATKASGTLLPLKL
jgi:hypothetical protein